MSPSVTAQPHVRAIPLSGEQLYTEAMVDESDKRVRAWRIVGWVVAILAVIIVAGPQILDLIGE